MLRASAIRRLCTRGSSLSEFRFATSRRLCTSSSPSPEGAYARFWTWTTQQRPSWKESKLEAAVIFVVFGVTGSTSVKLVRPALKSTIGMEGSMVEGPWSYRITSIIAVSPIYATLLVTFGTLAGRHRYFAAMSNKIFGRFLPEVVRSRIGRAFGFCFPGSLK
jgi:hypothetical protein